MRQHRTAFKAACIGLLFLGLIWANGSPARAGEKPLPGNNLTLAQAVQKADAVAVGRDLRITIGMGSAYTIYAAEAGVAECLKGDLPRGRISPISITVRPEEELPLTKDGNVKGSAYLLFTTAWEKNGRRGHIVIKMLDATEANVRAVRDLLPRR